MADHCADAEGKSGDGTDEGKDDAAHGDAGNPDWLILQQIHWQYEDRLQVWLHCMHEHADGCTGQADRDDDEGCGKGTD